jgi:hypothetical protein
VNSLSARLRCAVIVVVCGVVFTAAVVPVALAVSPTPKTGEYLSGRGERSIAFSVPKQQGKYVVESFTIQCFVNEHNLGAILLAGPTRVLGNGSFQHRTCQAPGQRDARRLSDDSAVEQVCELQRGHRHCQLQ